MSQTKHGKLEIWLGLIGHTTSLRRMQVKPVFLEPSHWGTFQDEITLSMVMGVNTHFDSVFFSFK